MGGFGHLYQADIQAGIHEQLQRIALLLTQDGKGSVEPVPRPMQLHEVALRRMEAQERAEEATQRRKSDAEAEAAHHNAAVVAEMDKIFNERDQ